MVIDLVASHSLKLSIHEVRNCFCRLFSPRQCVGFAKIDLQSIPDNVKFMSLLQYRGDVKSVSVWIDSPNVSIPHCAIDHVFTLFPIDLPKVHATGLFTVCFATVQPDALNAGSVWHVASTRVAFNN